MIMNQKSIFVGSPTQRCIVCFKLGCNENYAKIANLSFKREAQHCPIVVSKEEGHITYTRTLSKNDVPYGPSVSNVQGYSMV